jgi:hypothetical protein
MGKKKKAEHRALRAAIKSWLWRDSDDKPSYRDSSPSSQPPPSLRTELSATLFSGEASSWVGYLKRAPNRRYDPDV